MISTTFKIITAPITFTYFIIKTLFINIIYLPLLYLFSICFYIPLFKLPIWIPIRYILELNPDPQSKLSSQLLIEDNGGSHSLNWLMSQFNLFTLVTFHFILTSIYIGIGIGLIMGFQLSFISWFFTLDLGVSEGNNITIGDISLKNEKINKIWEKSRPIKQELNQTELNQNKESKIKQESSKPPKSSTTSSKLQNLKNLQNKRILQSINPKNNQNHLIHRDDDEEIYLYPTPKSDFEIGPSFENLRKRTKFIDKSNEKYNQNQNQIFQQIPIQNKQFKQPSSINQPFIKQLPPFNTRFEDINSNSNSSSNETDIVDIDDIEFEIEEEQELEKQEIKKDREEDQKLQEIEEEEQEQEQQTGEERGSTEEDADEELSSEPIISSSDNENYYDDDNNDRTFDPISNNSTKLTSFGLSEISEEGE
ncbi:uncharacterized protein KGF55_003613 [Candida pseudojiufengensis]|uniref:uncharacterized protein n=1 Tax=Candida pseudojiufengensis TaxID=497109 RepID=UPI002225AF29|nr:uncharacterized protein KGF55_003613 [Candida pseudojiufengensis]KAI5962537.1 hypothetical protein KGF55_003613 [Candida pseudojiufengensis]